MVLSPSIQLAQKSMLLSMNVVLWNMQPKVYSDNSPYFSIPKAFFTHSNLKVNDYYDVVLFDPEGKTIYLPQQKILFKSKQYMLKLSIFDFTRQKQTKTGITKLIPGKYNRNYLYVVVLIPYQQKEKKYPMSISK